MWQEPKAQIPGIDLRFSDGKTGRIWGISGIDDLRGESFEKASIYLRDRAKQLGSFEWEIRLELDLVISAAFGSLLEMLKVLDQLVGEKPDRRWVTIKWKVAPGDDSMQSMAEDVMEQIAKGGKKQQLVIEIVEPKPPLPKRR